MKKKNNFIYSTKLNLRKYIYLNKQLINNIWIFLDFLANFFPKHNLYCLSFEFLTLFYTLLKNIFES